MNGLTIANILIQRDAEGRYCLNDLHKASGGNNRHRPSLWLHNKQTKALIDEIKLEARIRASNSVLGEIELKARIRALSGAVVENKAGIPALSTTQKSGTYVVKELVYAYAMWVNPVFHLKVIRAYDALVNDEFVRPNIQHENYWFARRPHWPPIRMRALAGERYKDIALALGRSAASVARAVRRMIQVGILSPSVVVAAQKGPAMRSAMLQTQGWGQRQLGLFDAQSA